MSHATYRILDKSLSHFYTFYIFIYISNFNASSEDWRDLAYAQALCDDLVPLMNINDCLQYVNEIKKIN